MQGSHQSQPSSGHFQFDTNSTWVGTAALHAYFHQGIRIASFIAENADGLVRKRQYPIRITISIQIPLVNLLNIAHLELI